MNRLRGSDEYLYLLTSSSVSSACFECTTIAVVAALSVVLVLGKTLDVDDELSKVLRICLIHRYAVTKSLG